MTASPALTIGHAGDAPLELQLDRLLGSHAGIIANSGGGKSGLLRKILERTHGRVQHLVLDVEDEFYTLREKFDYVIAGGDGGDVPIALDTAASLARSALEHGFSLIVQLNDLGADAPEYVSRFLEGLMSAPKDLWHPVLVTIDELQRFAARDAGEATPAIKDLMFRGRKRGFTGLFASLRMAEIDPAIRGMVNNWLLGRVGQALDRRTMAEQLGFSAKDGRDKLAQMAERHFWAMGPALAVEPLLFKVDDVETTPVHAGQAKVATPPAPQALRAILASLAAAATPASAEVPASYPDDTIPAEPTAALRKGGEVGRMLVERDTRIAELEANLDRSETLRTLAENYARDAAGRIEKLLQAASGAVDVLGDLQARLARVVESQAKAGAEAAPQEDGAVEPVSRPAAGRSAAPPPPPKPPHSPAVDEAAGDRLRDGRQAILDWTHWATVMFGDAPIRRDLLAQLVGKHVRTKTFLNDLGALRTAGLIDYGEGGGVRLTEAGLPRARKTEAPATPADLRERLKTLLTPAQARLFDMLVRAWPETIARGAIADAVGKHVRTKTFLNDLGRLHSLGFVAYAPAGAVRAADFLMRSRA